MESSRFDPTVPSAARIYDYLLGSHLVLSQFAAHSDPAAIAALRSIPDGTPVHTYFRSREEIQGYFAGFDLLPPGVVDVEQWRAGTDATPTRLRISGGVGRKHG